MLIFTWYFIAPYITHSLLISILNVLTNGPSFHFYANYYTNLMLTVFFVELFILEFNLFPPEQL